MAQEPARRGRPPKKGTMSWKPATRLATFKKKSGFVYRWCDKDPENIERKKAEGWIVVNGTSGVNAEHEIQHSEDGSLDSAKTYRELVLMALPEETAKARREFFNEKTEIQERGIKRELQEQAKRLHPDAQIHGKIVIE